MLLIKIFSLSAVYGALWETISQSYKGWILTGLWKALSNSKWVVMSIHVLIKKKLKCKWSHKVYHCQLPPFSCILWTGFQQSSENYTTQDKAKQIKLHFLENKQI